ncbi:hypothetical protein HMPREF3192_01264 [Atopobium deltae]|uniref:Uncharacterized protein n=1 Tax=Atopobium deltae TaxID=1393034 RepID=A0A133XQE0_9ACTN|nr:hypothetical protein HMPREF3192_01264 [Atopobium deltae]
MQCVNLVITDPFSQTYVVCDARHVRGRCYGGVYAHAFARVRCCEMLTCTVKSRVQL